jgi:protein TonB
MRNWPRHALHNHINGIALLDCLIGADGTPTCVVRAENPANEGFGQAAVAISRSFKMAPQDADGRATAGSRIVVPITFRSAG